MLLKQAREIIKLILSLTINHLQSIHYSTFPNSNEEP
jgi:hypothetical protein